jgi:mono/diheme cytochrome c family protein
MAKRRHRRNRRPSPGAPRAAGATLPPLSPSAAVPAPRETVPESGTVPESTAPRKIAEQPRRRLLVYTAIAVVPVIAAIIVATVGRGTQAASGQAAAAAASPVAPQAPAPVSPQVPAPPPRDEGTTGSSPAPTPAALLFETSCGACHALRAAGTSGFAGPDLDELEPTRKQVLRAIENGGLGSGAMPAGILAGEDAELVARFVARSTRK